MALTVGSLFSGIGGIDLGLERAGMVTRWFCEIDPHCRNVLARHWPGLPIYGDIAAVDWSGVERVDVLAGGFPCQPVSNAGFRKGTDDARWLWPEFERAIRLLRPRYVLVENVAALRYRGLGIVLSGLAALGYDAEWECIPAAAVGAPHLRDRLWLVAYSRGVQREDGSPAFWRATPEVVLADASGDGREGSWTRHERLDDHPPSPVPVRAELGGDSAGAGAVAHANGGDAQGQQPQRHDQADGCQQAERPPGLFSGAGPSGEWPAEPDVGRVAHGIPHRVDRLRALGNAVVPQVVEWIGRRIIAFDEGRVAA